MRYHVLISRWRLMRTWYRTCFHTLYDEKKNNHYYLTPLRVTTSLLKSPGIFSIFWPILIMLLLGWFPLVFLFLSPPFPLVKLSSAPITIGITVTFMFYSFSVLWQGISTYVSVRLLSILLSGLLGQQSPQFGGLSFFFFFNYHKGWSSGQN